VISRLVILGATGDLTRRLLLPALAELRAVARLPEEFRLFGAARSERSDDDARREARGALADHARHVHEAARDWLLERMTYDRVDVADGDAVRALVDRAAGSDRAPVVVYVALPTGVITAALEALRAASLPHRSRIALENPFGHDAESAAALNDLLSEAGAPAGEDAVYRVDHALGMSRLHNLLALRTSNRTLREVWSAEHIAQIDVLWEETLALEGRAAFYDSAGALMDVMYSHMLQLLCVATMAQPVDTSVDAFRDRKVEVLRATRPEDDGGGRPRSRRARYTAGQLATGGGARGGKVPDYVSEDGVDPDRGTETWAEVVLRIDSPRWRETRVVLRAGKALAQRRKGVLVRFRPVEGATEDPDEQDARERLWIDVDGPDDIDLGLIGRTLGPPERSAALGLSGPPPPARGSPYAYVLAEILSGGSRLAVRADEAEESWRVLDPVVASWRRGEVSLAEYRAGSDGPLPLRLAR
jgi:glucose-6-phosphate 1-dehydrogenase